MQKLLLEYKGVPVILNHRLKKIDTITFITVYKTGDNDYIRKDFDDIAEALDFRPENATLKLTFVYIKSQQDGTNYVIYQSISFVNNKLIVDNVVRLLHHGFLFSVEFGFETFNLKKIRLEKPGSARRVYEIGYARRKTTKTATGKTFELLESYYEIFPRFEDIFLETLFMLDIMTTNYGVVSKNELEAHFLNAKLKIEKHHSLINQKAVGLPGERQYQSDEQVELSNLVGLDKIKLEIEELKSLAQFRKKRIELGLPVTPSTLHMVFTGNPGTGKTTVARLLGQVYYDIGLLASNKVVEVSRGDLVGEYVGHTAPKTQKVFESALGGILFIDEAYSLFNSRTDFGSEAVATLIKLMEDNRERIMVIIAGYPDEIEELLASNPGIKSRFSKSLHFDDYSEQELTQIFYKMVADYHNQLTEEAKSKIKDLVARYYKSGFFNSNARAVRNIFEETIKRQSGRLSKIDNPTHEEMTLFIGKDIPDRLH